MTESRHAGPPKGGSTPTDSPTEERKARSDWSRPLARPVSVAGGTTLVTLADVRSFMFRRLQTHPQPTSAWQRVTTLLLSAARSDEVEVADVTIALEMALTTEDRRQAVEPRAATAPPAPSAASPSAGSAAREKRTAAEDGRAALPPVDFSESAAPKPERSDGTEVKPTARPSLLLKVFR